MVSQICRSFFSFVNMWPKHVHMVCFCSSNASLWSSDFSVRVQTKCQRNSPRLTCSVPFCFPGMLVWVRRKWPAENSVGALDVQFWNFRDKSILAFSENGSYFVNHSWHGCGKCWLFLARKLPWKGAYDPGDKEPALGSLAEAGECSRTPCQ